MDDFEERLRAVDWRSYHHAELQPLSPRGLTVSRFVPWYVEHGWL